MEPLYILLSVVGFTAGIFLWSRIANTVLAIASTIRRPAGAKQRDPVAMPTKALLWFVGAAVSWLMIFGGLCLHFAGSPASAWAWFFGGAAGTSIFATANVVLEIRRQKRRAAARSRIDAAATADGASYTYRFVYDEAYVCTLLARAYRQRPLLLRPVWGLVSLFIATTVGLAVIFPQGADDIPFLLMIVSVNAIFMILAFAAIRTMVYQTFRYTSSFGKAVVRVLSDKGLALGGAVNAPLVDWSRFEPGVRYGDGILLVYGKVVCWLPDATLEGATVADDVVGFIESRIGLRRISEKPTAPPLHGH